MSNKRIYFAIEAFGIAPLGSTTFTAVHGLDSVGMNTRFNLEQAFELGQLALYQNIENLPDVEQTIEKKLDGYPLVYHLATQGAPSADLAGRANQRCMTGMSLFTDTQLSASGTPIAQVTCSGMYVQQVGYRLGVQGDAMEQVTLVGNNKTWVSGTGGAYTFTGGFLNTDSPLAPEGVDRRQHFLMPSGKFPTDIPGISASGTNDLGSDGFYNVKFQSVSTSVNLGRTPLLELGHKTPYFRYAQFPTEVRTDFEINNLTGDMVSATEAGVLGSGNNIADQAIYLQFEEGTKINLGKKNRCNGVNQTGGNATAQGGNMTTTFSYSTWDDFTVQHPQDPTVALAL